MQAVTQFSPLRCLRALSTENLARCLREAHPAAAASLEEGLDETLTVKRLALPSQLERILSTTNAIENLMGSIRGGGPVRNFVLLVEAGH